MTDEADLSIEPDLRLNELKILHEVRSHLIKPKVPIAVLAIFEYRVATRVPRASGIKQPDVVTLKSKFYSQRIFTVQNPTG